MPASRFQTFWLPAFLLALLTLLVFGRVLGFELVNYDDPINLSQNPWLRTDASTALNRFWSAPYEELYVPLTYSIWYFLGASGRTSGDFSPRPFHAANWIFHACNAVLVFAFLQLCLQVLARRDEKTSQISPQNGTLNGTFAALIGALLWALHPLQVEPVAWATGFKDVWGGFWALAALFQYARFSAARSEKSAPEKSAPEKSAPKLGALFAAAIFFVLALLAKPSAVVLPFVAWIFDVVLVGHSRRDATKFLAPALLPALLVVFLTKTGQTVRLEVFAPLWGRPIVAGDALTFYGAKILAPFSLGLDYGRTPQAVLGRPLSFLFALVPILVIVMAWKTRKGRWPLAAVGIFVAFLLPVLGLVPFSFQSFSTVADRYVYLALLGPALALAAWARNAQISAKIGLLALVGACGVLSFRQSGAWHDSFALNEQALSVNPNSPLALSNLAEAFEQKGDSARASQLAARALEIRPGYQGAALLLQSALTAQNRLAEMVPTLQKGVQNAPNSPDAWYVLGRGLRLTQRPDEAKIALNHALELDANFAPALNDLALLYLSESRFEEAARLLAQAIDAAPNIPEPHATYGFALENLGQNDLALAQYRAALAINPFYLDALQAAARLLDRLGRRAETLELLGQNAQMTQNPAAWAAYGAALVDNGQSLLAIPILVAAHQLVPNDAAILFHLGRAQWASGQRAAARAQWHAALKRDPNFAPAREALNRAGEKR